MIYALEPSSEPIQATFARDERTQALYVQYRALLDTISSKSVQNEADQLMAKASAYVWGRQDAGDRTRFDDYEFSLAYGVHAAAFKAGLSSSLTNLRSAYDQYRNAGTIS